MNPITDLTLVFFEDPSDITAWENKFQSKIIRKSVYCESVLRYVYVIKHGHNHYELVYCHSAHTDIDIDMFTLDVRAILIDISNMRFQYFKLVIFSSVTVADIELIKQTFIKFRDRMCER